MLSVSNLMMTLWLEVDSVEDLADFGSAVANPGAGGESDLAVCCVCVCLCVCACLCVRALIVKNQIKLIGLDWYRRHLCLL